MAANVMQQLQKRRKLLFPSPETFFHLSILAAGGKKAGKKIGRKKQKRVAFIFNCTLKGLSRCEIERKERNKGILPLSFFRETESRAQRKRKNFKGRKGGIEKSSVAALKKEAPSPLPQKKNKIPNPFASHA